MKILRKAKFIVMLSLTILISSCFEKQLLTEMNMPAQGGSLTIKIYACDSLGLVTDIDSILKKVDNAVSVYNRNSIISKINRNEISRTENRIFLDCFNLSKHFFHKTCGAFDPTVGPLINLWGFGPGKIAQVDSASVDSIMQFVGFEKVKLREGNISKPEKTKLDFNAIAQGYTVDLICSFLENRGIENYLIELCGEVRARGSKPDGDWRVGMERPAGKNSFAGAIAYTELNNAALATSGNWRKFKIFNGLKVSHIIDPASGRPAGHSLLSVTVMAENCAKADALSTALLVMGREKAKEFCEKEKIHAFFIFFNEKGELEFEATPGFIYFSE